MKSVVAFANGTGGKIIFGIADKTREVVGFDKEDVFKKMDAIANAVSDSCESAIIPIKELLFEGSNRYYDQALCTGLNITDEDMDALCKAMKEQAVRNAHTEEQKAAIKDVGRQQLRSWGVLIECDGKLGLSIQCVCYFDWQRRTSCCNAMWRVQRYNESGIC